MSDDKPESSLTPTENLLIGETPALLSNRFYVTSSSYGAKITFAEGFFVDGKQEFRSRCAIYLVPDDLQQLHHLLGRIIQSMQSVPIPDPKSTENG